MFQRAMTITGKDPNGMVISEAAEIPWSSVKEAVERMKRIKDCDFITSDQTEKVHYKTKNGWRCG